MTIKLLTPDQLYRPCDTGHFTFTTTNALEDLAEGIGQIRAIDAAHVGIGMRHAGYKRYVMGPPGSEEGYRIACVDAENVLKARVTTGRCVRLSELNGASQVRAVRREGAGCLLLADRERFLGQADFERILDEIECPIVLTR